VSLGYGRDILYWLTLKMRRIRSLETSGITVPNSTSRSTKVFVSFPKPLSRPVSQPDIQCTRVKSSEATNGQISWTFMSACHQTPCAAGATTATLEWTAVFRGECALSWNQSAQIRNVCEVIPHQSQAIWGVTHVGDVRGQRLLLGVVGRRAPGNCG